MSTEMKSQTPFKDTIAKCADIKTRANSLMDKITKTIENAAEEMEVEIDEDENGEKSLKKLTGC